MSVNHQRKKVLAQGKDGLIVPFKKKKDQMNFKKIIVQGKATSTGTETSQSFPEKLAEIGSKRSLNMCLWENAWLPP